MKSEHNQFDRNKKRIIIQGKSYNMLDLMYDIMKREITNATAQTHKKKRKKKEKKRETEGEKEDCFPKLVININQQLNEALTLLIHTIT